MTTLPTLYQQFIHLSRYARWRESDSRRETWDETVARYFDFFEGYLTDNASALKEFKKERQVLESSVLGLEVMPSMRALMTAGPALQRDNVAGFNCSYVAVDHVRAFDETMYILMCGTGIGFSVERQFIAKLPEVSEALHTTDTTITVHDSKIGWAKALKELISLLYAGQVPSWDMARLRPAGARLKTFGGRASGPEPLDRLFKYVVGVFKSSEGRKLTSIECHDIMCMIADVVVVGGVRRSAMISLSNLSDDRMRNAKSGRWYELTPHRQLANNSAVYNGRPDMQIFLDEWRSLFESHSGERGIFNRQAAQQVVASLGKRDPNHEFGCNPCSEIILRSLSMCNLSEAVIRRGDTLEVLMEKVRVASILGTLQSCLTNFRYLRKGWQKNVEEERLLGVSLTGLMDHETLSSTSPKSRKWLKILKQVVIDTNGEWALILGINPATATTCIKPSGTVSQLVDCSSGLHARYSEQYIRTVRADVKDPMTEFMSSSGIPCESAIGKPEQVVFSFPVKSPKNSIVEGSRTAIEQLEYWKMLQDEWCEHKPSCTVYYKEEEFLGVGDWIYKNFDSISGISFLPYDDHVYDQAPYQPITIKEYKKEISNMPKFIDWDAFSKFEDTDNTSGSQTYACSGSVCEVVDIE